MAASSQASAAATARFTPRSRFDWLEALIAPIVNTAAIEAMMKSSIMAAGRAMPCSSLERLDKELGSPDPARFTISGIFRLPASGGLARNPRKGRMIEVLSGREPGMKAQEVEHGSPDELQGVLVSTSSSDR